MNTTLKGISLNLLLRNFFAGVFFIGSIYRGGVISTGNQTLAESLASGTLLALIAGTFVYAIHRTLMNPLIEIFRYSDYGQRIQEHKFFSKLLLSDDAVDLLVNRWDHTLYQDSDKEFTESHRSTPARYRGLSSWSDYIHLFYCSGLSIALGALVSKIVSFRGVEYDPIQFFLAIAFLLLGLLSDIRRQYVEDRCISTPDRLKRLRKLKSESNLS